METTTDNYVCFMDSEAQVKCQAGLFFMYTQTSSVCDEMHMHELLVKSGFYVSTQHGSTIVTVCLQNNPFICQLILLSWCLISSECQLTTGTSQR